MPANKMVKNGHMLRVRITEMQRRKIEHLVTGGDFTSNQDFFRYATDLALKSQSMEIHSDLITTIQRKVIETVKEAFYDSRSFDATLNKMCLMELKAIRKLLWKDDIPSELNLHKSKIADIYSIKQLDSIINNVSTPDFMSTWKCVRDEALFYIEDPVYVIAKTLNISEDMIDDEIQEQIECETSRMRY